MKKNEIYIIGNSYSCLLLSTLISNRKVYLICDKQFLGGVFNGYTSPLGHFDLGMNYIEIYKERENDIKLFNPNKRNDFLKFTHKINKYFKDNFKLKKVPVGLSYINGELHEDFIIFDKLSFLSKIPRTDKEAILSQLNFSKKIHPSNKYSNKDYQNYSYKYICKTLYGSFFYENYLEPFLKKVFNCDGSEIPAIFHRLAWMPLYYPETIKDAINGVFIKVTNHFYYPETGNFNKVVAPLKDIIQNSSNIEISNKKVQFTSNQSIKLDNKILKSNDVFIGKNIKKLSNEDSPSRTSLILVFTKIKSNNLNKVFSVINVIDNKTPIFRITNQSIHSRGDDFYKLCFEVNKDYLLNNFNEINVIDEINAFLLKNKIVKKMLSSDMMLVKYFDQIIELPTFKNFESFNNTKIMFNNFNLLSPAMSFFSNSLNEQITESIKASEILNNE